MESYPQEIIVKTLKLDIDSDRSTTKIDVLTGRLLNVYENYPTLDSFLIETPNLIIYSYKLNQCFTESSHTAMQLRVGPVKNFSHPNFMIKDLITAFGFL